MVMDSHGRVSRKKFENLLGLVRTEVIGNDVDLPLCGLTPHNLCKEIDELLSFARLGRFLPSPNRAWPDVKLQSV